MRILLCLLAFVAAPAWAEWVKVGENTALTAYLDPATIRKNGNFRKVWLVLDMKAREKNGLMSRKSLVEYDCNDERSRTLSLSAHSESMAGGNVLYSQDGVREWSYIAPDTFAMVFLRFVCVN